MNYVDRAFEEAAALPIENRGKHANRPHRITEEVKAKLRLLWAQTAPMLAAKDIGAILGVTKNAVLGLRFRMKLPGRTTAGPRGGERKPRVRSIKPRAPWERAKAKLREWTPPADTAASFELPPDHSSCAKPFMEIGRDECRYPVGKEGEPFMFCAASSWSDGESYCLRHHQLTHKFTAGPKRPWREGRRAA